jgi:hypothetical protein
LATSWNSLSPSAPRTPKYSCARRTTPPSETGSQIRPNPIQSRLQKNLCGVGSSRGRRGERWRGPGSPTARRATRSARGGRPAPASRRPCESREGRGAMRSRATRGRRIAAGWSRQAGSSCRGGRSRAWYLEAVTKRAEEADEEEPCELPMAAAGSGRGGVGDVGTRRERAHKQPSISLFPWNDSWTAHRATKRRFSLPCSWSNKCLEPSHLKV